MVRTLFARLFEVGGNLRGPKSEIDVMVSCRRVQGRSDLSISTSDHCAAQNNKLLGELDA